MTADEKVLLDQFCAGMAKTKEHYRELVKERDAMLNGAPPDQLSRAIENNLFVQAAVFEGCLVLLGYTIPQP